MLEVTKFGVAYAGSCDTGCWTCVIPMLEGGMLHGEGIGKLWDVWKLSWSGRLWATDEGV